jgi:hypothetical protein
MFDDLQSDGLNDGRKRERPAGPERPLADREVPLGPPTAAIADAVHAWLDGEAPESSVRRAEWSRDVDFWKRMNEDLERRRRQNRRARRRVRCHNRRGLGRHGEGLAAQARHGRWPGRVSSGALRGERR